MFTAFTDSTSLIGYR